MNDVTLAENPFGKISATAESAGARGLQARENSEVMALAMMAKRFPRDLIKAADRIRNSFTRRTLAESAQYQFARGGQDITGPSIRAAEAIAQQWGNMSNGWREISRIVGPDGVGVSEVEAFCVDYESGNRESITFVVRHWRDTKSGGYKLKDERDIYELCANQAQRRKRAVILAQIPGDVTEMAMEQASATLKASADTSPDGIKKLLEAFADFGVTKEQIEKRIQRRIDSIMPAQVVGLKRVWASLRDQMSMPSDWFEVAEEAPKAEGLDAVRDAAQKKGKKPPAPPAVDPETGETGAPPPPPPAVDETPPTAKRGGPMTYAERAEQIKNARDAEDAAMFLDFARGELPPEQAADLGKVYKARWSGKA